MVNVWLLIAFNGKHKSEGFYTHNAILKTKGSYRMAGWSGYLDDISETFNKGVSDLHTQIEEALVELSKKPSDPKLLAAYQSKLSEYNLYRSAQSNVVKVFKDIDASIIQNFR